MPQNRLSELLGYGRDFAQGTSNAFASNVSAPVDGLAWLLRKAGVPMPSNPVGGSDWLAQQGLMAEPKNRLAGLLGEAAGMSGPMVAAAKGPQLARGLLGMMENASAPRTLSRQAGAINWPGAPKEVYHGSGKDFDKFDMSKIQSNTKANDAGIGWHFSDNKSDAGFYADMGARNLGVDKGHVGKWDVNMKNPLVIGLDEADGNVPAHLIQKLLNDKFLAKEYALKNGHDGIIYPYGTDVDAAWTGILFDGKNATKLK